MDQEEIDKVVLAYMEKRGFQQTGLAFQQEKQKHKNGSSGSSNAQIDPDLAKQMLALSEVDGPAEHQEEGSKLDQCQIEESSTSSRVRDTDASVPDTDTVMDLSSEFTNYNIFDTREDLLRWARQVGRRHGMVLTIKMSDNGNNRRRRPYVVLACERGGNYRKLTPGDVQGGKRRRETGTKKCGCPFELKGTKLGMEDEDVGWELTVICGTHNHTKLENMEGHSFAGRLSSDEMALVEDMSKGRVKPKDILTTLKRRDDTNAAMLKTVYNARQRLKVKEKAGRSKMELLIGNLARYKYMEWHRSCEKTDEVSDMLWMHPTSIGLIRSFPYVLIIDCTYKSNLYHLPLLEIVGITSTNRTFTVAFAYLKLEKAENYEWVLRRLLTIMEGCSMPNVIVTDRELELMKALANVYPNSRHILCRWSISKNILDNCKKMFVSSEKWRIFEMEWTSLVHQDTEESFNIKWYFMKKLFADYPDALSYIEIQWLDPFKDRFVSAWTDTCMHLGIYTSNRAEGSHSKLKAQLGLSQGDLADSWPEIDKLLLLQHTDIEASFEKSKNVKQPSFRPAIFNELRGFVSMFALEKVNCELKRARDDLTGPVEVSCKCNIWAVYGLPCAHKLYEFQKKGIPIPLDCVDSHWKNLSMEPNPSSAEEDHLTCSNEMVEFLKFFEEQDAQNKRRLIAKLRELYQHE